MRSKADTQPLMLRRKTRRTPTKKMFEFICFILWGLKLKHDIGKCVSLVLFFGGSGGKFITFIKTIVNRWTSDEKQGRYATINASKKSQKETSDVPKNTNKHTNHTHIYIYIYVYFSPPYVSSFLWCPGKLHNIRKNSYKSVSFRWEARSVRNYWCFKEKQEGNLQLAADLLLHKPYNKTWKFDSFSLI